MVMCSPAAPALGPECAGERGGSALDWKKGDRARPSSNNNNSSSNNNNNSVSSGNSGNGGDGPGFARVNLHELRAQIVKRFGTATAGRYFSQFRSFLGGNCSKQDLDASVFSCLGKEGVALHNQLVRAVLRNAVHGKEAPSSAAAAAAVAVAAAAAMAQDVAKPVKGIRRKLPLSPSVVSDDASPRTSVSSPSVWSNGPPRKGRERPSLLGPPQQFDDDNTTASASPDLLRPSQDIPGATEQSESEFNSNSAHMPPVKRIKVPDGSSSESDDPLPVLKSLIKAPLGIPFCPGSVGGSTKKPPPPHLARYLLAGGADELQDAYELPSVESLHKQMELIATGEDLHSVSGDCACLLKQGMDTYLKSLIKSCIDIASSRRSQELNQPTHNSEQQVAIKPRHGLNGITNNSFIPQERQRLPPPPRQAISLHDFKTAVELNPKQLGENWALQLEKISFRLSEH